MSKELMLPLIRHMLSVLFGSLIAKGTIDSEMSEQVTGLVLMAANVGWMYWEKKQIKAAKVAASAATVLMLAFCLTGCKTTLAPGGPYAPVDTTTGVATAKPDMAFYNVESGFKAAYASLDFVFNFERDNRAMLWKISPEIKHTLDRIRPDAVKARDDYIAARTVYALNPVPASLTGMQAALSKVEQLLATATAVIATKQGAQ